MDQPMKNIEWGSLKSKMDAKGSIQKLGVSLNDKYSGENEALGLKTSGFRIDYCVLFLLVKVSIIYFSKFWK